MPTTTPARPAPPPTLVGQAASLLRATHPEWADIADDVRLLEAVRKTHAPALSPEKFVIALLRPQLRRSYAALEGMGQIPSSEAAPTMPPMFAAAEHTAQEPPVNPQQFAPAQGPLDPVAFLAGLHQLHQGLKHMVPGYAGAAAPVEMGARMIADPVLGAAKGAVHLGKAALAAPRAALETMGGPPGVSVSPMGAPQAGMPAAETVTQETEAAAPELMKAAALLPGAEVAGLAERGAEAVLPVATGAKAVIRNAAIRRALGWGAFGTTYEGLKATSERRPIREVLAQSGKAGLGGAIVGGLVGSLGGAVESVHLAQAARILRHAQAQGMPMEPWAQPFPEDAPEAVRLRHAYYRAQLARPELAPPPEGRPLSLSGDAAARLAHEPEALQDDVAWIAREIAAQDGRAIVLADHVRRAHEAFFRQAAETGAEPMPEAPPTAPEAISPAPEGNGSGGSQASYEALVASGGPDRLFKKLLPEAERRALKKGETWRGRVEARLSQRGSVSQLGIGESAPPPRVSAGGEDPAAATRLRELAEAAAAQPPSPPAIPVRTALRDLPGDAGVQDLTMLERIHLAGVRDEIDGDPLLMEALKAGTVSPEEAAEDFFTSWGGGHTPDDVAYRAGEYRKALGLSAEGPLIPPIEEQAPASTGPEGAIEAARGAGPQEPAPPSGPSIQFASREAKAYFDTLDPAHQEAIRAMGRDHKLPVRTLREDVAYAPSEGLSRRARKESEAAHTYLAKTAYKDSMTGGMGPEAEAEQAEGVRFQMPKDRSKWNIPGGGSMGFRSQMVSTSPSSWPGRIRQGAGMRHGVTGRYHPLAFRVREVTERAMGAALEHNDPAFEMVPGTQAPFVAVDPKVLDAAVQQHVIAATPHWQPLRDSPFTQDFVGVSQSIITDVLGRLERGEVRPANPLSRAQFSDRTLRFGVLVTPFDQGLSMFATRAQIAQGSLTRDYLLLLNPFGFPGTSSTPPWGPFGPKEQAAGMVETLLHEMYHETGRTHVAGKPRLGGDPYDNEVQEILYDFGGRQIREWIAAYADVFRGPHGFSREFARLSRIARQRWRQF